MVLLPVSSVVAPDLLVDFTLVGFLVGQDEIQLLGFAIEFHLLLLNFGLQALFLLFLLCLVGGDIVVKHLEIV